MIKYFESSIFIEASPEKVFERYSQVSNWAKWDIDVKKASLVSSFDKGHQINMTPVKGPNIKILITKIETNKSFQTCSRLPFCNIIFDHDIDVIKTGVIIKH